MSLLPCTRGKRLLFSLVVFCIVFFALGLPYTQWGFDIDDCGVIWHSQINSLTDFISLFSGKDAYSYLHPSHYQVQPQYFFNVFYRPLYRVFCGFQYYFFGGSPYGYLLVMIFFHALNAVLLFNIFLSVFHSFLLAFFGALYFAFQTHLACWMGWIAAQFYPISLFFLLMSLILFFNHLKRGSAVTLVFSVLMYAISLFLFELVIIWPICLGLIFFTYDFLKKRLLLQSISLINFLKKVSALFVAVLSYLAVRLLLYPISASNDPGFSRINIVSFFKSLQYRLCDLLSFLVDISHISLVPPGNRLFKGVIVGGFTFVLAYLFYMNDRKREVFVCFLIMILLMWPAILRFYVPRYFYHASVFFTLGILFLIQFYRDRSNSTKMPSFLRCSFCLGLVGFNMIMLINAFSCREEQLSTIMQAYDAIVDQVADNDKPLCFIGLPRDPFRAGLAQALWVRGLAPSRPVYYDISTFTSKHALAISKKGLSILSTKGSVFLKSLDRKSVSFIDLNTEILSMGRKRASSADTQMNKVYDIEYVFDKKYNVEKMYMITWDYEKHCFKSIGDAFCRGVKIIV